MKLKTKCKTWATCKDMIEYIDLAKWEIRAGYNESAIRTLEAIITDMKAILKGEKLV